MHEYILSHEPAIRLIAFLGVFAAMALWELAAPRRVLTVPKGWRWASNIGIVVLNTVLLRLLFPVAAVGLAVISAQRGWGLFNNVVLPGWFEILAAVMALDLAIYLQHVMFHAVPALWRLHSMHHADLDFDVTTGARFHPIEIVLSMLIKLAVVAALGPPAVAVVIFEVSAQCDLHVQSQQRARAACARPMAAARDGDARHAPRAPLGVRPRDQQQFRLQPAVVGSPVRHLSSPAGRGT